MTLLRLMLQYAYDFVLANITLAVQVLSPRMTFKPQTIKMETKVQRPLEVLALSNLITFTPGSLAMDIQPGKYIVVHVLMDGPQAERTIRQRLEQPLLKVTRGDDG
jgi:multicomponent Na+:H+ antiporter subunit E